jgi:predicted ribonuclease toxin of YeeF-YezG toxin-antitoxin module
VATGQHDPGLLERTAVSVVRALFPDSTPTKVTTRADGTVEIILGGGPTSGGFGQQAAAIAGMAGSVAQGRVAKEVVETVVDATVQEATGAPVGPSALTKSTSKQRSHSPNTQRGLVSTQFPQNARRYFRAIENKTGFRLHKSQRAKLIESLQEKSYSRLSTEASQKHRRGFTQTVRDAQIMEWERQTGQLWPQYAEDVLSADGRLIRRAGQRYDAHHIIENIYGGPHEWWNITPARFPSEHQGGIHVDSIMDTLFD